MSASYNDLYPERRGTEVNPNVFQRATGQGHPRSLKTACDRDVVFNVVNMPMVQHMMSALRTAGCEVDLTRHISCDMCMAGKNIEHAGGYDPALNQVLYNANCFSKSLMQIFFQWCLMLMFF